MGDYINIEKWRQIVKLRQELKNISSGEYSPNLQLVTGQIIEIPRSARIKMLKRSISIMKSVANQKPMGKAEALRQSREQNKKRPLGEEELDRISQENKNDKLLQDLVRQARKKGWEESQLIAAYLNHSPRNEFK